MPPPKSASSQNPSVSDQLDLRPGQSIELLKALHILTREGKLNQDSRRKLKQVHHLCQFIEKILQALPSSDAGPTLADHGAGEQGDKHRQEDEHAGRDIGEDRVERAAVALCRERVELRCLLARDLETVLVQQSRINSQLQEGLMRSRMVPFASILPRIRRVVGRGHHA